MTSRPEPRPALRPTDTGWEASVPVPTQVGAAWPRAADLAHEPAKREPTPAPPKPDLAAPKKDKKQPKPGKKDLNAKQGKQGKKDKKAKKKKTAKTGDQPRHPDLPLTVMLTPELAHRLNREAAETGLPQEHLVHDLLDEWLEPRP